MAWGQRCLVLAPKHDAVDLFLAELIERIEKLNPRMNARLALANAIHSDTDLQRLLDEAQRTCREGGHLVIVQVSLNAMLDRNLRLMDCKRLFGAARATDAGGTVTVVAVATEPPITELDRDVLREFEGTGNMQVALRVDTAQNVISVDPTRSGTKHSEIIKAAM
jgi:transcription termination factor Rho